MRTGHAIIVGLSIVGACGKGEAPIEEMSDAGADARAESAPRAPEEPRLAPCPQGWSELAADGLTVCEPIGLDRECGGGEASFIGSLGCEPVGHACPEGNWSDHLPDDAPVLYVASTFSAGTGTRDQPFNRLPDAIAAATDGTVIAVGKGSFEEVIVPAGVSLIGACAAETRLEARLASADEATLTLRGSRIFVRDLSIEGPNRWGIAIDAGEATLEGVVISHATRYALRVERSAQLIARNLVIRATSARTQSNAAILVDGGELTIERGVIQDNVGSAMWLGGPSSMTTLRAVAILDTSRLGADLGEAIFASDGATLEATELVLDGGANGGVIATGAGTQLTLRQSLIRNFERGRDERFGRGVSAGDGALAVLERVHVDNTQEAGLFAVGIGSRVDAIDVLVENTHGADGDIVDGFGLGLEDGGHGVVRRGAFISNQASGIFVSDGCDFEAQDIVVRNTRTRSFDGILGQGLHLAGRSRVTRALLDNNRSVGAVLIGSGPVELEHLEIHSTLEHPDGSWGAGLYATGGMHATLRDIRVVGNRMAAMVADGTGTRVIIDGAQITDTDSAIDNEEFGVGLLSQRGAHVSAQNAQFLRNQDVAVIAQGHGTLLELTDVMIAGTREAACAQTSCAGAGRGIGLAAYRNGHVSASRFEIVDNALAGIQLAEGGTMDLSDGRIAGHPIGANVQTESFDTARIDSDVLYENNDRNLDAASLSVAGTLPAPPQL